MSIEFEKIHFVLRSIIGSGGNPSFVTAADARGGYKQLFRIAQSWHQVAYFLRFRLPDGEIFSFWVLNPCNFMGGKRSAQVFESCFQLFTLGLYFNFPSLFTCNEERT